MKPWFKILAAVSAITINHQAWADDYNIDTDGAHAFIQFKIAHLGFSWILGRFNDFSGQFSYDENNPSKSKIKVTINTNSIDTNHAVRDKHLRDKKFLNVTKYPKAMFVSTSYLPAGIGKAILKGDFTLHGVTRPITIDVKSSGAGKDPWGGYRRGFEGSTKITLADYNITYNLGPAAKEVELFFTFEGIRQ